jgi:hypothetical protein
VRGYFLGLSREPGSRPSLSGRGQFLNTFAGMGFFLAFTMLALGGYLIEQQFADPVQAQSVGLVVAALLISTAITLLYCLVHPPRKLGHRAVEWPAAQLEEKTLLVARSGSRGPEDRQEMPLRGRYVDRTRIHIQR